MSGRSGVPAWVIFALIVVVVVDVVLPLASIFLDRWRLRALEARERRVSHIVVVSRSRATNEDVETGGGAMLVIGTSVVGISLLRRFFAYFRLLVGGRMNSIIPALTFGRRLAICRLRTAAAELGATTVVNLRLETADIRSVAHRRKRKKGFGTCELMATGTALLPNQTGVGCHIPFDCPHCGYRMVAVGTLGCSECGWGRERAPDDGPDPIASPPPGG